MGSQLEKNLRSFEHLPLQDDIKISKLLTKNEIKVNKLTKEEIKRGRGVSLSYQNPAKKKQIF